MTAPSGAVTGVAAWLFDLDGVLTDTARVHAAAWKQTFDDFLRRRAGTSGFEPFDAGADYERYVDGKPRYDGVRDFLASRGITLPEGGPEDPPTDDTVAGVGNRKNELVLERLARGEVTAFPGSRAFVAALRGRGVPTAVVSASENCVAVLRSAGIEGLFDAVVDGTAARRRRLRGKPAPDTYLAAAGDLGVTPGHAAVVEDALAGVSAGRAGDFGLVVGVARHVPAPELRQAGADLVVDDLGALVGALSPGAVPPADGGDAGRRAEGPGPSRPR